MIMCKEQYAKQIDRSVFPGMQGGPHDNVTAAKAIAFGEALKPEFIEYSRQVILNAQALGNALMKRDYRLVSGGTDNHLFVLDLSSQAVSGKEMEKVLEKAGISVSRSTIPNDPNPPFNPSGLRIGTPALTTRGLKEKEMELIAEYIDVAIKNKDNEEKLQTIKQSVSVLCQKFPINL
jgi:glycine hydroxymethyltransferase